MREYKNRIIIIIICLMLSSLVYSDFAAGNGTENNPYQITTHEHLNNVRNYLGVEDVYFMMMNDIDLTDEFAEGGTYWNNGQGWIPIGAGEETEEVFKGNFNGNGYTVNGVFISNSLLLRGGLFGFVRNGVISNLGVTNSNIHGLSQIGGIAGRIVSSSILNCYTSVDIQGLSFLGGLVGSARSSYIYDSHAVGEISGNNTIGGLFGLSESCHVLNCYASVNITTEVSADGLIGNYSPVGDIYNIIENSYYNYESVLINGDNIISLGAINNEQFTSWIENDKFLDINDYFINQDGFFLIDSVDDFLQILPFGQFEYHSFKLMNDIDLSYIDGFYIPYFRGLFDGNYYSISNLYLDLSIIDNLGLFGVISNGVVRNLGVVNCIVNGGATVGGVVGNLISGTVENSFVTGFVSGVASTGGFFGTVNESNIENNYAMVFVSGMWATGGFIGSIYESNINNCYSIGNVYSDGSSVGGFIGYGFNDYNTVTNSYWNIELSGQTESYAGEGRTIDEMIFPYAFNTYVEWDFDNVWSADNQYLVNSGFPYLQWQYQELSAPINLTANALNDVIELAWEEPYDTENLVGYNVYRDYNIINYEIVTETNYNDDNVTGGITYVYYVTALYESGESLPSEIVEITALIVLNTPPVVFNVIALQRTDGSMLVDIFYDVFDADGDELTISMQVSDDEGLTWDVFCELIEAGSDIGEGIFSGDDKHIVWDIGAEHPGIYSEDFKFKVIADDGHETEEIGGNMVFVQGTAGVTFEPGGYGYFNPGAPGGGNYNVSLSDFYISKYEVTQAEYEAVMGSWDSDPHGWGEYGVGDNHPVYYISWFNAIEYCNRLSILEGLTPAYSYGGFGTDPDYWPAGWNASNANHDNVSCNWNANGYMLPTEMQMEYAARGGVPAQQSGTFNTTYAGSNNIDEVAWYWSNSGSTTHPVGTKLPNELGLYDMSGNVWNWVWDRSSGYPSGSHTDPTGPSFGIVRVRRGGSWGSDANFCSVSNRSVSTSADAGFSFGLRLSRVSF